MGMGTNVTAQPRSSPGKVHSRYDDQSGLSRGALRWALPQANADGGQSTDLGRRGSAPA